MMQKSLHQCARLKTLHLGSWHRILEKECGCPHMLVNNDSSSEELIDCDTKCRRCDSSMQPMMQSVLRNGLTMFLVEVFEDKYNCKVTPTQLSKQLFEIKKMMEKLSVTDLYLRKRNHCKSLK